MFPLSDRAEMLQKFFSTLLKYILGAVVKIPIFEFNGHPARGDGEMSKFTE